MSEHLAIEARGRATAGKGAARAARREGFVPGIIYGGKNKPVMMSVEQRILVKLLEDPSFFTQICDIKVDGKKHQAMAREVQADVVTGLPTHIDFLRVSEATEIQVAVPVVFVNEEESPGLKRGALLNIVRHEVDVVAPAGSIPDQLEVDLTGYDVGDTVHFSSITMPAGIRPAIDDRDFTIATIAAPSAMKGAEEEEEAATEEAEAEGGDEETTSEEE